MQFDEHIRLELYDGHTPPGQIVVLFDTEEGNYAFPGDVVPTSLNLSPGWLSAYDNSVAVAMEEKLRFFWKRQRETVVPLSFTTTLTLKWLKYKSDINPTQLCGKKFYLPIRTCVCWNSGNGDRCRATPL